MDVSIIIVNHNTKAYTEQTVASILRHTRDLDYEIIVVDNSSDSQEQYVSLNKQVQVLSGIENRGFGQACNLGSQHAKGEVLLFLNSDTQLQDNAIYMAVQCKRTKKIGAVGVHLVLPDGKLDHGCKRGFPTPQNALTYFLHLDRLFPESKKMGQYRAVHVAEHEIGEVDCISGAFLMLDKVLFLDLGGFDEDFFLYGEDLDLCYRIKQKGLKIMYYPLTTVIHFKGKSGLEQSNPDVIRWFYQSMVLFYDKHYRERYGGFLRFLVWLAIYGKMHLALWRGRIHRD